MGSLLIPICVMALFAALSAFWAAAETSLFSLSYADRARLKRLSPHLASQVSFLLGRPRELLVTLLLGSATVSTAYYVVGSLIATDLPGIAGFAVTILSLLLLVVAGEILPKTLAALHPGPFARVLITPLALWFRVVSPLRAALDIVVVTPLTRLLLPGVRGEKISVDDLAELLEAGARSGTLRADEERLLADVLELGTMRARDVMTPRVEMAWVDEKATGAIVADRVLKTGVERFAVMRGGMDGTLVGLLDARRYIAARAMHSGRGDLAIATHMAPPTFVPEAARLDQVLDLFRATGSHLAFCVDEFGALTGRIEVNDIVSQLLASHTQVAEEAPAAQQIDRSRWMVSGRLGVRDWQQFFGAEMRDASRVATINGLITARLGRLPRVGDQVRVGGITLRVESLRGRVADQIEVSLEEQTA